MGEGKEEKGEDNSTENHEKGKGERRRISNVSLENPPLPFHDFLCCSVEKVLVRGAESLRGVFRSRFVGRSDVFFLEEYKSVRRSIKV